MNKVRTYCLLLVLLVLIGWGESYAAPVKAIGPFNEGLASSEPEEHPVDRIEAAKVADEITPDEAALYKLYAFTEPDKLPSQFQFEGPVTEWPRLTEVNSSLIAISLMVNEIKKDWDTLEPQTKETILNYKPAKQQATPICFVDSAFDHFKVCYSSAATATEANTLGNYLEDSWDYITRSTASSGRDSRSGCASRQTP